MNTMRMQEVRVIDTFSRSTINYDIGAHLFDPLEDSPSNADSHAAQSTSVPSYPVEIMEPSADTVVEDPTSPHDGDNLWSKLGGCRNRSWS